MERLVTIRWPRATIFNHGASGLTFSTGMSLQGSGDSVVLGGINGRGGHTAGLQIVVARTAIPELISALAKIALTDEH